MRSFRRTFVASTFVSTLCAAMTSWSPAHAVDLPEITSESEEGFHDLVFALVAGSDERTLRVTGKHKGTVVGFEVRLGQAWKEGKLGDLNLTTYQGTVALTSVGRESDELARVIDKLYDTKLAPRGLNAQTTFTALSLEGNPTRLKAGPVKLKLFFESKDEHRYAEVFLNIDFANGRVHLNEKDPDYRKALVLALGVRPRMLSNKALHRPGAGGARR